MKRLLVITGMVAALSLAVAAPARADSAGPTNYLSVVESIEPANLIEARVLGGDSFLEIEAISGTEVVVFGYQQEPYLLIQEDGRVYLNRNSPAFFINDDRFGQVAVPATASPDAEPDWLQVGTEGRYGWHDHRIHWMAPLPPPGVEEDRVTLIQEWTVPLEVDGRPVVISGRLSWIPATSPIPSLAIGSAAFGFLAVVRRRSGLVLPVALVLASTAGLLVGIAQAASSPLGFGGEVLGWSIPALGLIGGIVALVRAAWGVIPGVGGAALMVVWSLMRISSLWMPVLPTGLPTSVERAAVAVAAISSCVAFFAGFQRIGRLAE